MVKRIPLNQGKICLVDDEDYDWVKKLNLHAIYNGTWYVRCDIKSKHFMLHRLILNATKGVKVDHISGNGLDNRRCNLRPVTPSQNNMNRVKSTIINGRTCTSVYKGVSWNKPINKWIVHIKINGKARHVGCFTSEIDAAKAYNEEAKKVFGEYAKLNEVED
jgi:hypothetical protein